METDEKIMIETGIAGALIGFFILLPNGIVDALAGLAVGVQAIWIPWLYFVCIE